MPATLITSAINQVRDNLSLDFAEGSYLNNVGSNLGVQRPPWGFSDTTWRAVVKILGLGYKQIKVIFADLLEVLIGPQVTLVASLASDEVAGVYFITLNDCQGIPQTGVMVFDEGQATEESIKYVLTDRYSNVVTLDTPTAFAHFGYSQDTSTSFALSVNPGDTDLYVFNSAFFPASNYPYTLVLSKGTPEEESVVVNANNATLNRLTLVAGTVFAHSVPTPTAIQAAIPPSVLYTKNIGNVEIRISDDKVTDFPIEGFVRIGEGFNADSTNVAVVSGTTTTVTAAPATFFTDQYVQAVIRFDDTTATIGLRGVTAPVVTNTTTTLTLGSTLTLAPAAGDTFTIISSYFEVVSGTTTTVTVPAATFTLNKQSRQQIKFSDLTTTLLLRGKVAEVVSNTDAILTLKNALPVGPVATDTFSVYANKEFYDVNYVASYITLKEPLYDIVINDLAAVELLDSSLAAVDFGPIQIKGTDWDVIQSDPRNVEILLPDILDVNDLRSASYLHDLELSIASTTLSANANAGDTSITLTSSAAFPIVGVVSISGVERIGYAKDPVTPNVLQFPTQALVNNFLAGDTVSLYEPAYAGTDLLIGNYVSTPDTFPGPYLYNIYDRAPNISQQLGLPTRTGTMLAGPVFIAVDQQVNRTALEVEDASHMALVGFPYPAVIGEGSGNRETINVNDVFLWRRVQDAYTISSIVSNVVNITAGTTYTPGGDFPVGNGFRVIFARGTINQEVCYVTSSTGTGTGAILTLESIPTLAHVLGETVGIIADVLRVDNTSDFHKGAVTYTNKTSYPPITQSRDQLLAEQVQVQYTSIPVVSVTGFFTTGGHMLLNFGQSSNAVTGTVTLAAAGAPSFTLASSIAFPLVYPFVVVLSPGKANEEIVIISGNNTGSMTLTLSGTNARLMETHVAGSKAIFYPGSYEVVPYTDIETSPSSILFDRPIVLQYNHYPVETVISSLQLSVPKSNGYDFPFRMPQSTEFRIKFLFDLVRAAGVQVTFINKR